MDITCLVLYTFFCPGGSFNGFQLQAQPAPGKQPHLEFIDHVHRRHLL